MMTMMKEQVNYISNNARHYDPINWNNQQESGCREGEEDERFFIYKKTVISIAKRAKNTKQQRGWIKLRTKAELKIRVFWYYYFYDYYY